MKNINVKYIGGFYEFHLTRSLQNLRRNLYSNPSAVKESVLGNFAGKWEQKMKSKKNFKILRY